MINLGVNQGDAAKTQFRSTLRAECNRLDSAVPPVSLVVGNLRLEGQALLAPMAGVTDAGMRRLAQDFGATLAVSEMVAAPNLSRGDAESRIRSERQGAGVHAVQIAGCRVEDLAEAGRLVEACGADLIDINMGCPAKRVTGGLAGSALMRDLDHAAALIRATVAAVSVPVTVKMRLGWDETALNAPELARRAEAEGAQMITVHGRTRCQFYTGHADWAAVGAVKAAVGIPVVVNGDCRTAQDAVRMLAQSGADAVMIGRAAVGRPWLVGDIGHYLRFRLERHPPSPKGRLAVAIAHYESLLHAFGRAKGLRHARKHLAAYTEHVPLHGASGEWRRELVTSEDSAKVLDLLERLLMSDHGKEQRDAFAA